MLADQINEALKNEDWKTAIVLLDAELKKEQSKEIRQALIYNLIVAYTKLKKWKVAYDILYELKDELQPEEVNDLYNEIKVHIQQRKNIKKESGTITEKEGRIINIKPIKSDIKFTDVIGMQKEKKWLKINVIYPIQHQDIYSKLGAATSGGVIMYGPPGTGKTLLARAIAGEINGKLLSVNLADILNKFVGDSEKNIQKVFDIARAEKPSIIFIDEIDGIAQKREANEVAESSGPVMRNLINTFMINLDGITKDNAGIFVMGATNKPWELDSAIKRSGRFSDFLYIAPPRYKERRELFKYYTQKINAKNIDYAKLALYTFGFSPADIKDICQKAASMKAAKLIEKPGSSQDYVSTKDLLEIAKEKKNNSIYEWYSIAYKALKGMSIEERQPYKQLIKDMVFWLKRAKSMQSWQRILSLAV
ncbi:MAG: ATP-binding protein [Thermoproteota archaeon]